VSELSGATSANKVEVGWTGNSRFATRSTFRGLPSGKDNCDQRNDRSRDTSDKPSVELHSTPRESS